MPQLHTGAETIDEKKSGRNEMNILYIAVKEAENASNTGQ